MRFAIDSFIRQNYVQYYILFHFESIIKVLLVFAKILANIESIDDINGRINRRKRFQFENAFNMNFIRIQ